MTQDPQHARPDPRRTYCAHRVAVPDLAPPDTLQAQLRRMRLPTPDHADVRAAKDRARAAYARRRATHGPTHGRRVITDPRTPVADERGAIVAAGSLPAAERVLVAWDDSTRAPRGYDGHLRVRRMVTMTRTDRLLDAAIEDAGAPRLARRRRRGRTTSAAAERRAAHRRETRAAQLAALLDYSSRETGDVGCIAPDAPPRIISTPIAVYPSPRACAAAIEPSHDAAPDALDYATGGDAVDRASRLADPWTGASLLPDHTIDLRYAHRPTRIDTDKDRTQYGMLPIGTAYLQRDRSAPPSPHEHVLIADYSTVGSRIPARRVYRTRAGATHYQSPEPARARDGSTRADLDSRPVAIAPRPLPGPTEPARLAAQRSRDDARAARAASERRADATLAPYMDAALATLRPLALGIRPLRAFLRPTYRTPSGDDCARRSNRSGVVGHHAPRVHRPVVAFAS